MATITSLGFTLFSKWIGRGVKEAHDDLEKLDKRLRDTNMSFSAATGRVRSLQLALVAAAPSAAALGAGAVAGAGMAVVAFGTAGAAAGAYGAVLGATVKRTLEMYDAGEALTAEQDKFIKSVNNMTDSWKRFLTEHEPQTLEVARIGVEGLTAGISKLNPIIDATHPIIKRVAEAWRAWMEGPKADRFVEAIVQEGVPALDNFVAAGRNVMGVFGLAFRTLLPYVNDFSVQVRIATAAFDKWAFEDQPFVRFLEYIREISPLIKEFFWAVVAALGNLGRALFDIAPIMLQVATIFLQLIANTPVEVLQAMYFAFVALKVVQSVNALLGAFVAGLSFLLTPAGLVVAAIAAIAAVVVYLKTQTDFFETEWPVIWSNIKAFAEPTITWIIDTVKTLGQVFGDSFRAIRALVNGDFQLAMEEMRAHEQSNADWSQRTLQGLWTAIKDDVLRPSLQAIKEELALWGEHFRTDWSSMWSSVGQTLREEGQVWLADFKGMLSGMTTSILDEGQMWNQGIDTAYQAMKLTSDTNRAEMTVALADDLAIMGASWDLWWSDVTAKMGARFVALKEDWSQEWDTVGNKMTSLFQGLDTFLEGWWTDQQATFSTQAGTLAANLAAEWNSSDSNTRSLWEGTKAYFRTWWGDANTDAQAGSTNVSNTISTSWTESDSKTRSLWTALGLFHTGWWDSLTVNTGLKLDILTGLMSEKWSAIDTNTRSLLGGLGVYFGMWWDDVKNKFQGGLDWLTGPFMAGLRGWWDAKTRGWRDTVNTIGVAWDVLKGLIRDPIQKVIDVVYNGGIVKVWNTIAESFGGSKLNEYKMPGWAEGGAVQGGGGGLQAFREGGPVRGPGTTTSDSIVGRLSHNEHVWTAKEVAAAGGHHAVAALRSAVLGGRDVRVYGNGAFADGGGVLGWLQGRLGALANVARGAAYGVVEPILTGVKNTGVDLIRNIVPGDGNRLEQAATGFVRVPIDKILDWIKSQDAAVSFGVDMPWPQMWSIVRSAFPDASLTSAYRPGDPGYHGQGRAIDVAWPMDAHGTARMLELNRWIASKYPQSTELIHTPGINLKNGKPMNYGTETQAAHWNHVHWAMAGTGGGSAPASVDGWRTLVIQELAHFGQSPALADLVLRRINQESGGNARAINTWDLNAQNGTPSKGLMQVIDPTFNAFKNTNMHPNDIWDPGANIHAAFNYAFSRYGSLENAFNRAGGYKIGTPGANRGWHMAGENGVELIKFRGGERVYNNGDTADLFGGRGDTFNVDVTIQVDATGASSEDAARLERAVTKIRQGVEQGIGEAIGRR